MPSPHHPPSRSHRVVSQWPQTSCTGDECLKRKLTLKEKQRMFKKYMREDCGVVMYSRKRFVKGCVELKWVLRWGRE